VSTRGRGLSGIGAQLSRWLGEIGADTGLLSVFIRHTSASLVVQENADPQVLRDLEAFLARLVPDGDSIFGHVEEGEDDMPAHVRAALTQVQLSLPVNAGRLLLGTWQEVYVYEHRLRPHSRELVLHFVGSTA